MALFSLFMWLSKRGKWEKKKSWKRMFSSGLEESMKMTPMAIFFFRATPRLGPPLSSDILKLSSTDLSRTEYRESSLQGRDKYDTTSNGLNMCKLLNVYILPHMFKQLVRILFLASCAFSCFGSG